MAGWTGGRLENKGIVGLSLGINDFSLKTDGPTCDWEITVRRLKNNILLVQRSLQVWNYDGIQDEKGFVLQIHVVVYAGLPSESPNLERLASTSIRQSCTPYVHRNRFAECEGYVKRLQMP